MYILLAKTTVPTKVLAIAKDRHLSRELFDRLGGETLVEALALEAAGYPLYILEGADDLMYSSSLDDVGTLLDEIQATEDPKEVHLNIYIARQDVLPERDGENILDRLDCVQINNEFLRRFVSEDWRAWFLAQ